MSLDYSKCKLQALLETTNPLFLSAVLVGEIFSGFISYHIPGSIEFYVVVDDASLPWPQDFRRELMWWLPEVGEKFLVQNDAPEGEEGKTKTKRT